MACSRNLKNQSLKSCNLKYEVVKTLVFCANRKTPHVIWITPIETERKIENVLTFISPNKYYF